MHQWRNKEYEQGLVVAMRFDLELPFLWESISYKDWQSAANRVRDRLLSQIGEEFAAEATAALVERRFSIAPRTVADIGAVRRVNRRPAPPARPSGVVHGSTRSTSPAWTTTRPRR